MAWHSLPRVCILYGFVLDVFCREVRQCHILFQLLCLHHGVPAALVPFGEGAFAIVIIVFIFRGGGCKE